MAVQTWCSSSAVSVVAVEVDAGVAVDLEVEEYAARIGHIRHRFHCPNSPGRPHGSLGGIIIWHSNNSANEILLFVRRRQEFLRVQPVTTHDLAL